MRSSLEISRTSNIVSILAASDPFAMLPRFLSVDLEPFEMVKISTWVTVLG